MANMIIKPAVGGNLLIQDRAGGAVLSTGTSGATIASNVTGIPAAGVTGTLPNAVQDNVTRLGTVTSGNLSNTNIVYPSGHVLQVHFTTVDNNITGPSSNGHGNAVVAITAVGFEARKANSIYNVAFHCKGGTGSQNTSWLGGVELKINSGSWTLLSSSSGASDNTLVYSYFTYNDPRQNKFFESVFTPTSAAGDTMNFRIAVWGSHTGTINYDGLKMIKITEIVS
jgi:hypothetical protein